MPKINPISSTPKAQAFTTTAHGVVTQNTFYTVLDTVNNARIYQVTLAVGVANEDIELRVTIDGQAWTFAKANAVAGTGYYPALSSTAAGGDLDTTELSASRAFWLEGRSIKIEARKTTNNNAGSTLTSYLRYFKM